MKNTKYVGKITYANECRKTRKKNLSWKLSLHSQFIHVHSCLILDFTLGAIIHCMIIVFCSAHAWHQCDKVQLWCPHNISKSINRIYNILHISFCLNYRQPSIIKPRSGKCMMRLLYYYYDYFPHEIKEIHKIHVCEWVFIQTGSFTTYCKTNQDRFLRLCEQSLRLHNSKFLLEIDFDCFQKGVFNKYDLNSIECWLI